MLYLQIKYARMLGASIDRWHIKKESPFHGNGRCPVCGDSHKVKSKTRFHVREHGDTIFVSCFNCGLSTNLIGFLKNNRPELYSEYIFEKYKSNSSGDSGPVILSAPTMPLEATRTAPVGLKSFSIPLVSDLTLDSPVSLYAASRMLPKYPFYYAERFYEFASQYNEDVGSFEDRNDEPRLVIPFFDREGNIFAFQGRDLSGKSLQKYITITIDDKVPKIFGIDKVSFKKPFIIVEGPIDSLFLDNAVASVNAGLVSTANKLISIGGINKSLMTLVFDNEPRNKTICGLYDTAIGCGYSVVIWPIGQREKDINDLVLSGKNPHKIIKERTYSGLSAKLKFNEWKRI